jgi:hypothetical protein
MIIEERGFFWPNDLAIPERLQMPTTAVAGVLKIDDEGSIRLELDDVLRADRRGPPSKSQIIQGLLRSTRYVLLNDAYSAVGTTYAFPGISHEHYAATACLIGWRKSFGTGDTDLAFAELLVSLEGFEDWLRIGGINVTVSEDGVSAVYEPGEDFAYDLDDRGVRIFYDIRRPGFSMRMDEVHLKQKGVFSYTFNEPISLAASIQQYRSLEDFFIILTNSERNLRWPGVRLARRKTDPSCDLYFKRDTNDTPPPIRGECMTNLIQLRDNFPDIHQAWINKREKYGPGFYMYTATRRGRDLYAEHEYISLVSGLETLHRATHSSELDKALKQKIERILAQIDIAKDKSWLKGRLRHAHEPSLDERLFQLISDVPLPFDAEALKRFTNECANLRNDLSHRGELRRSAEGDPTIRFLIEKSSALSVLYHFVIMLQIGIEPALIREWFDKGFRAYPARDAVVRQGLLKGYVP